MKFKPGDLVKHKIRKNNPYWSGKMGMVLEYEPGGYGVGPARTGYGWILWLDGSRGVCTGIEMALNFDKLGDIKEIA